MNHPTKSGGSPNDLMLTAEDIEDVEIVKKHFDNKIQQPIYEVSQLQNMTYRSSRNVNTGCHAGQRKLLMTEIQFYCNIPADSVVVYSGSASGDHTTAILEMFPGIKLILIDPAYHTIDYDYTVIYQNPDIINKDNLSNVKRMLRSNEQHVVDHAARLTKARTLNGSRRDMLEPSGSELENFKQDHANLGDRIRENDCRVYIIQDYLTPELADLLVECNLGNICYVSDIRSTMMDSFPTDADYLWNDALQLYLIKKLRPLFSMLKFHPPYFDDESVAKLEQDHESSPILSMMYENIQRVKEFGLDMIENYKNKKHMYLDNIKIYLQTWAPVHSSETRLIVEQSAIDKPYVNYDHGDWDNKFYYLRFLRSFGYYDMFYKYVKPLKNNPYDGCFDCMLEMFILGKYMADDHGWDMDAAKIARVISKNPGKLIELSKIVHENLLYPSMRSIKCGFHDQITQPLKGLNMFMAHENELFKISVTSKNVQKISLDTRNLNIASNTRASGLAFPCMKRFINRKSDDS
jgi:hypothetical protein